MYLVAVGSWLIRRATQLCWADVVRFHLRLLLAAAVVEIGLWLLAAPLLEPGRQHRGLLEGPANRDQAWAAELFDEWLDVRYEYERFVGWRVAPMKRHHTNVDERGRLTTQPSGIDESVPAIFFFGGSTMWGAGARDSGTIPSAFAAELDARGLRRRVFNYGQPAYVFEQEVLKLWLLLKAGARPEAVVFYDGHNDASAAYRQEPGALGFEDRLRRSMVSSSSHLLLFSLKETLREHVMLLRVPTEISSRLLSLPLPGHEWPRWSEAELAERAHSGAAYYLAIQRSLHLLAKAYGFRFYCFWQPTFALEAAGTDAEYDALPYAAQDPALRRFHRLFTDEVRAAESKDFYDISDALAGRTSSVYLDGVHLSEEGNAMVAQRIASVVLADAGREAPR